MLPLANISLCILNANAEMSKQEKETPTKTIKAYEIIKKELKTDEQKNVLSICVKSQKKVQFSCHCSLIINLRALVLAAVKSH